MRVVLIRHAHVLIDWLDRYSSRDYDLENEAYDLAPIEELKPIDIAIEKVYISSLPRSAATAAFLVGEKRIEKTKLLDEVPIRSFRDTVRKLPTWLWNSLATIQWHRNSERQLETRQETDRRIDAFLAMIEDRREDCIIVGHGIYFYEMMKRMHRRGYQGRIQRYMRNGEVLEFRLDLAPAEKQAGQGPLSGRRNRKQMAGIAGS